MVLDNQFLGEIERTFLGADLHSGLLGAQGGSKARSGTGATRSEASMARTHPLARLSTRLIIASGGPKLMRSCFGFCRLAISRPSRFAASDRSRGSPAAWRAPL